MLFRLSETYKRILWLNIYKGVVEFNLVKTYLIQYAVHTYIYTFLSRDDFQRVFFDTFQ